MPWSQTAWVQTQVLVPTSSTTLSLSVPRLLHLIVGITTASGGSDGKASAYNAGDQGSIPG